jgi:hypothetical protein
MQSCTHLDQIRDVEPSEQGCEDCPRIGGTWVHLRECLSCWHVGCCDSSASFSGRNAGDPPLRFSALISPSGAVAGLTVSVA